jgi:hypothetical protein
MLDGSMLHTYIVKRENVLISKMANTDVLSKQTALTANQYLTEHLPQTQ